MTTYKVIDDLEAGVPRHDVVRANYIRVGLPSTVVIWGGSGHVMLSNAWMAYVRKINSVAGRKYQFVDWFLGCKIFKNAVGWHNSGKRNRIEQLTFSGNIVDVTHVDGNKAYVRYFRNDLKPPDPIFPISDSLDTRVQLFTTQYKTWLDMTTNGRFPRTIIIANPGERLWIDIANLRKVENA
jgi:hypothetical protein